MTNPRPVEETLRTRSVRDSETGCLRWTGKKNPTGYGMLKHHGKDYYVHRLAYEMDKGPIPEGLVIDHVASRGCKFRDCIEPTHLEAVSQQENLLRGQGFPGIQSRITHCPSGHEYSEENTMMTKKNERKCRTCNRERNRAWYTANRKATRG